MRPARKKKLANTKRTGMKRRYIMMVCAAILIVGAGYKMMVEAGIWDDIKSVGSDIKKTASDVGTTIKTTGTQAIECLNVAPKAVELAAKEVAYASARTSLDAALALQSKDPRIVALQSEIASYQTAMAGIDAGAATGKFGVEVISSLGQTVGKVLAGGFNLKKVEFEANLVDLKAGKTPMASMEATVGGKLVKFKVQADFRDIPSFAKSIFESVKSLI